MWRNAQEEILNYIDESKQNRIYEEREDVLTIRVQEFYQVYQGWWRRQPNKNVLPRVIDIICRDRYVADFVRLDDDPNEYHGAVSSFSRDAVEWRIDREEVLRHLVTGSSSFQGRIQDGVDPLNLAAVAFSCTVCEPKHKQPPLYPSILTHGCCYNHPSAFSQLRAVLGNDAQLCHVVSIRTGGASPWSAHTLHLGLWYKRAVAIIKACGQDPTTVTRLEMDALPVRLWCTCCSEHYSLGDIRQVMTWRDAVRISFIAWSSKPDLMCFQFNHYNFHDKRNGEVDLDYANDDTMASPLKWACMSGDEITGIIEMEGEHSRTYYDDFSNRACEEIRYGCMHCDYIYGGEGFKAIIRHLRISLARYLCFLFYVLNPSTRHSIDDPSEKDFYQPADTEPFLTRPVIIRRRNLKMISPADAEKQIEIMQFRTGCAAPAYLHDF